ncbi:MAG: transposase, partial [Geobacteraceae bacterium]|nr:transposase [Geobacteraceae bacterium]
CYHKMLRGNARQDIFLDDVDRFRFYLLVQEKIERFGCRVHAYCLMINYIHLVIQVDEKPLSRIMQNLSDRYTRWVNWRHNRVGHLFRGRYKAVLIDADSSLVQLTVYLHLNPVRSGMAATCEESEWSSHRSCLGANPTPWLTTEKVLPQFSKKPATAKKLFLEYVWERNSDGHRDEFHGVGGVDSRVFGEDCFVNDVLRKAGSQSEKKLDIDTVLKVVESFYRITPEELMKPGQNRWYSEARSMAALGVSEWTSSTLMDLAKIAGRDITSLSSAVKRLTVRANRNPEVAARMADFMEVLEQVAKLQS